MYPWCCTGRDPAQDSTATADKTNHQDRSRCKCNHEEVQSEDEEPYTEDELEDLANLPTDSKPKDLGDIDSEDYDDIDPEQ